MDLCSIGEEVAKAAFVGPQLQTKEIKWPSWFKKTNRKQENIKEKQSKYRSRTQPLNFLDYATTNSKNIQLAMRQLPMLSYSASKSIYMIYANDDDPSGVVTWKLTMKMKDTSKFEVADSTDILNFTIYRTKKEIYLDFFYYP